jgi:peptidase M28-like protein
MRQRAVLLLLIALLPALGACTRSAGLFSESNARAHVSMLAGTIGSRPVGSEANARARAYIIDQLKLYGYEVRVQETDATRPELGRTVRVANIIASLGGRRPEAIGLVSHYDSAPESPGAADDGLGVAVCLETARVVAARADRQWTTFVLVTDGEESDLMGAAAMVTDRVVAARLQAYVNVEAAGSDGTAVLFQSGPGNAWLTTPWARMAPNPRGGSFAIEVYRRLPNDTDFTIFARQNIPGLNFAAVDDGYSYHTARDVPERLTTRALRTTGENVVAVVNALDKTNITQRSRWGATYFDVGGVSALSYGMIVSWIVAATALMLGGVACIRMISTALQLVGPLRWLIAAVWALAGVAAVVATMAGATWALRAAREVYHPWYAHPDRLFLLLAAVGATTGWAMTRAGAWLPDQLRAPRNPVVMWSFALPVWLVLAALAAWLAPAAAYLWTLPLFAAGALLVVVRYENEALMRVASIVILAVAGTLWLRNAVDLLRFATAVLGRLPIITPVYAHAAILAGAGVMIAPPLLGATARPQPVSRPALVTGVCLLAVAVAAGAAALAPAYTSEHPLRRHIRALQEPDGRTIWEVTSLEPGIDLGPGAPAGWTRATTAVPASVPWGRFRDPFVFRATGIPLGAVPAELAGFTIKPFEGGSEVSVTIIPQRRSLAISFVLPAGLTPLTSSFPGAERLGQWTATFIAPPPEGIAWRATFHSADAARLRELRVAVTDSGFPDGQGWQRLPGWLPQEHTVWTATATWVVDPATLAAVEPVPPLR